MMARDKIFTSIMRKIAVGAFICTCCLLLCWTNRGLADSAKDSKKQQVAPAPPSAIQKPGKTAPSPTIAPSSSPTQQGTPPDLPKRTLAIDYFRKKVDIAPGTLMGTHPMGSSAPDSATLIWGEGITLEWGVKGCGVTSVDMRIHEGMSSARIPISSMKQTATSDGCIYYSGETTITPRTSNEYRLVAESKPCCWEQRSFNIVLHKWSIDIMKPQLDEITWRITLKVRNIGNADLIACPINVSYELDYDQQGSFRTPPLTIRQGEVQELGHFQVAKELRGRRSIRITLKVENSSHGIDKSETFDIVPVLLQKTLQ